MDKFQETVENNNEISQTLSHISVTQYDEDDLENELKNILEDEEGVEYKKVPKSLTKEEPITYGPITTKTKTPLFS